MPAASNSQADAELDSPRKNVRLKDVVEGGPRTNLHRNPDPPKSEIRAVTGKRSTHTVHIIQEDGFWPPHPSLLGHAGLTSGDGKVADTGQGRVVCVCENIRDASADAGGDLTKKTESTVADLRGRGVRRRTEPRTVG